MFFRKRSEEVTKKNIFAYICNRQKAIKLSVLCMCKALHVTESGYYKWKRNRHKVKKWQLVLTEMHTILEAHEDNDNYGVTRMKIELKQKGIKCSRSTVLRIMRMESFFATLKKEKLYRIDTKKLTIEQVKTIVWRYIMVYYNRLRINTFNEGGYPPSVYRQKSASIKAA